MHVKREKISGAIIGDLSASIYEYNQIKQHSQIEVKNIIEKQLFIVMVQF